MWQTKTPEAETVKAVLGSKKNHSEVFVEKMDAVTAAAMAEQANINTTGMRIISRFLRCLFGYSILQHSANCVLLAISTLRPQSYREDQWKHYRLPV
jgi:hypothetical protein